MTPLSTGSRGRSAPIFALLHNRTALGTLLLAVVGGVALARIATCVVSHMDARQLGFSVLEPVWPVLALASLLALHLLCGRRIKDVYREYRLSWQLGQPDVTALDLGFAVFLSALCTAVVSCPAQTWCVLKNFCYVGLLVVLLLLHVYARWSTSSVPHGTTSEKLEHLTRDQEIFLSEAPIERAEDDTLGRAQFVRDLSVDVLHWSVAPTSQSVVFGLYGGWGQGKSSVLNLLQSELETYHDAGVLTARFDPWRSVGADALVRNFGATLDRAVTGRLGSPGIGRLILRYAKTLGTEASVGRVSFVLPGKAPIDSDVYEALSHALKESGRYLVILIDEVDRLEREEIIALFSIVRSAFSIPRVAFILAMEPDTVLDTLGHSPTPSSTISLNEMVEWSDQTNRPRGTKDPQPMPSDLLRPGIEKLGDQIALGRAWLDKIVGHPVYLPRIPDPENATMFRTTLETAGFAPAHDDRFWTDIAPRVYEYVLRLVRSPRQLRRFATLLGNDWQRSLGEDGTSNLNARDLLFMDVLKLFFPSAFADIWTNSGYYIAPETWLSIYSFMSMREGGQTRPEYVREHVQSLCDGQTSGFALKGILELLFPLVNNATSGHMSPTGTPSGPDYRQRRVYHPSCFPFYFVDRIPGTLSPKDIARCVKRLELLGSASSPELVREAVPELFEGDDRRQAIGRLEYYVSDLSANVRYDLATVLIQEGCGRDMEETFSWLMYAAVRFEVPSTGNPDEDLAHLKARLPLLPRIVDVAILGEVACRQLKSWNPNATAMADATSIEVERRLYNAFGLPMGNVTSSFVDEQLGQVIMRWFNGWGLDHSRVEETSKYLVSLATNNVEALVNLLRWYHRDDGLFNLGTLDSHFGQAAIFRCLQVALETPTITADQRTTLEDLKAKMLAAKAKPDEDRS